MQDDEDVVVVLVQLRPVVARVDVLVVERVEVEVGFEPVAIGGPRRLDLDPADAGRLDDLAPPPPPAGSRTTTPGTPDLADRARRRAMFGTGPSYVTIPPHRPAAGAVHSLGSRGRVRSFKRKQEDPAKNTMGNVARIMCRASERTSPLCIRVQQMRTRQAKPRAGGESGMAIAGLGAAQKKKSPPTPQHDQQAKCIGVGHPRRFKPAVSRDNRQRALFQKRKSKGLATMALITKTSPERNEFKRKTEPIP